MIVTDDMLHLPSPVTAQVYACGIHLCNTLGIRAAQLFNENVDVRGFAFVPCCFPTSRHLTQDVIYQLGQHQFAAKDFLDATPGLTHDLPWSCPWTFFEIPFRVIPLSLGLGVLPNQDPQHGYLPYMHLQACGQTRRLELPSKRPR